MRRILTVITAIALLAACNKDKTAPLQPVDISVALQLSGEQNSLEIPYKGAKVTIINQTNNSKYTDSITVTNTNMVKFQQVIPGTYHITVELRVSAADYEKVTGQKVSGTVIFSGTLTATAVASSNALLVELRTGGGTDGWVFKQIYYAGSNVKDGASFRDQFIELYNNSDQVLYADSLYFAQIAGVNTALSKIDYNKGWYMTATGQYDWSKMPGNAVPNANTDFIYASAIFRIPGTGSTYPVEPGKSLIIAATAINHKIPFVDNGGTEVSVRNPDLTVDLSRAEFDVYMGDFPGKTPLSSDLKTTVTKLVVIANVNRDLILDNLGRDGFMLFRTKADIKAQWKQYKLPDAGPTEDKTYFSMPKSALEIYDAVEIQPSDLASRVPKRLSVELDAGFSYVPNGKYSSQALLRKTHKTINGRVVLQDTNNSILDFVTIKADPSKNAFTGK